MEELKAIYLDLVYERAMLNCYYKTRTKSKDEFFENAEERASVSSEVTLLVANMLPKQALNLLQKNSLNEEQQNELEAIIQLLNPQQKETLDRLISEIKDSRLKKDVAKRLKEIK